jgi:hypothetical protein
MLAPEKKGLAPELFLVLSTPDTINNGMSTTFFSPFLTALHKKRHIVILYKMVLKHTLLIILLPY